MEERKSQHSIAPLIDGELLVARSEDLELQGGSRSKAGAERCDEGEENCLHEDRKLPRLAVPSASRRRQPALRETPVSAVTSVFSGQTTPERPRSESWVSSSLQQSLDSSEPMVTARSRR